MTDPLIRALMSATVGDILGYDVASPKVVKWLSATSCDICNKDCTTAGKFFVDGPVRLGTNQRGPWALMCESCHRANGFPTFGTGLGQKYDSATLTKIEG